jgi:hypothetical protein
MLGRKGSRRHCYSIRRMVKRHNRSSGIEGILLKHIEFMSTGILQFYLH